MGSLPVQMPRHPSEEEAATIQSRKEDVLQYFPKTILAKRQDGDFKIRQLTFASKASLKFVISLNPSSLSFLVLAIFDQAIQHIFFLSADESHQKCVRADWIILQREVGSLKKTWYK